MTIRTKRRLLTLVSSLLFICVAGVAAWPDLSWSEGQFTSNVAVSTSLPVPEQQVAPRPVEQHLAPSDFQPYWTKPLRRPLFDPPPPAPPKAPEKPAPRPLTAKLMATMVEPGNSMAMMQLSTGEVVFRKLGEEIGAADSGAIISAIEEGVIKVVCNEVESKLEVPGRVSN